MLRHYNKERFKVDDDRLLLFLSFPSVCCFRDINDKYIIVLLCCSENSK